MKKDCFECELKKQRLQHKKVIQEAREIAKKENRTVTIYRDSLGNITITPTDTIQSYITSHL